MARKRREASADGGRVEVVQVTVTEGDAPLLDYFESLGDKKVRARALLRLASIGLAFERGAGNAPDKAPQKGAQEVSKDDKVKSLLGRTLDGFKD